MIVVRKARATRDEVCGCTPIGCPSASVSGLITSAWPARRGPARDDFAVVDQEGVVHGVEELRVIDASVFPDGASQPERHGDGDARADLIRARAPNPSASQD